MTLSHLRHAFLVLILCMQSFSSKAFALTQVIDLMKSTVDDSYIMILDQLTKISIVRLYPNGSVEVLNEVPTLKLIGLENPYLKTLENEHGDLFVIRNNHFQIIEPDTEPVHMVQIYKFDKKGLPDLSYGYNGQLRLQVSDPRDSFLDFALREGDFIGVLAARNRPKQNSFVKSTKLSFHYGLINEIGRTLEDIEVNSPKKIMKPFVASNFSSTNFTYNQQGFPRFVILFDSYQEQGLLQKQVLIVHSKFDVNGYFAQSNWFDLPIGLNFTDAVWNEERETLLVGYAGPTPKGPRYALHEISLESRLLQKYILPIDEELGSLESMRYNFLSGNRYDSGFVVDGIVRHKNLRNFMRFEFSEKISEGHVTQVIPNILDPVRLNNALHGDCKLLPPYVMTGKKP